MGQMMKGKIFRSRGSERGTSIPEYLILRFTGVVLVSCFASLLEAPRHIQSVAAALEEGGGSETNNSGTASITFATCGYNDLPPCPPYFVEYQLGGADGRVVGRRARAAQPAPQGQITFPRM